MSSGARDDAVAASTPRYVRTASPEDDGNSNARVRYSREFLLAVGASEACREYSSKLPAGIVDALRCVGLIIRTTDAQGQISGAGCGGAAAGSSSRWVAPSAAARSLGGRHGHADGDGEDTNSIACFDFLHSLRATGTVSAGIASFAERMINILSSMQSPFMGVRPPPPHRPTANHSAAGTATAPAAASFGASATAKISVDAALAGAIIGRSGATIKRISQESGARLWIRDHESDAGLNNVELEGTFDKIKDASAMVMEVICAVGGSHGGDGGRRESRIKTRLCEHFLRGSCSYGGRCRFAHGEHELRGEPAAVAARYPCGW